MNRKKVLNLDKICRVCTCERKDMRPLFSEKIPDMLMECTNLTIVRTDGWPDKICLQCVHSLSRHHTFKTTVEKCNKELHDYITNLADDKKNVGDIKLDNMDQNVMQADDVTPSQILTTLGSPIAPQKPKLCKKNLQSTLEAFQVQDSIPHSHEEQQIQRQGVQAFTALVGPVSQPSSQQQQTQHLLQNPSVSGSLPQIVTLPNGHLFTTPILAQSLSIPTSAIGTHTSLAPAQNQIYPQLLQANGQTFQLITQANGTQALQIMHLVPQRSMNTVSSIGNSIVERTMHIIGEADIEEGIHESYEEELVKPAAIETIILEDESNEQDVIEDHEQEMLRNSVEFMDEDTNGLEYFDEISEATSQQIHADSLPDQLLNDDCGEEEEPGFIVEDDMDAGITEDEDNCNIHGHTSVNDDNEFIQEPTQYIDGDSVEGLSYTVMDANECNSVMEHQLTDEADIRVFHITDKASESLSHTICDEVQQPEHQAEVESVPTAPPPTKRSRRNNNSNSVERGKLSSATSRQLAVTASIVANNAGDEGFEVDTKLLERFIETQTTMLQTGRYLCKMCSTQFKQVKGLQNHMYAHANWIRANCKKQPQCDICQKSFKGPGMLRMHMKTHIAETSTPTCNFCNKTFKSKPILYRHRIIHQQRRFACAVSSCGRVFSNASNLRTHSERKHADVQPPQFCCSGCSQRFDDANDLNLHVTTLGECPSDSNEENNSQQTVHNLEEAQPEVPNGEEPAFIYSTGGVYIVRQS